MATFIVAVIVFGIIGLIVFSQVRKSRKRKSDNVCGAGCNHCPYDSECK